MSERYTRLFALPENLYAEGAPVVIAAGALLKDNQTGKVLAQLKFRSISSKTVKGLKVSIAPLDMVSNPLGEKVEFQYLDLNSSRDHEFGQKTPVFLPNAASRGFSVTVNEVVFTDNTVWSFGGGQWETLQKPVPLDAAVLDYELRKQIKLEYGNAFNYMPAQNRDLWICSCGELNREGERTCVQCRQEMSRLFSMDMEDLKAKRDERLEKEAAQAEQARIEAQAKAEQALAAAKVKAKKVKKLASIVLPVVAVVIVAAVLISGAQKKKEAYNEAMEQADGGHFEKAISILEEAGYKNAEDQIYGPLYEKAVGLMEAGEYQAAWYIFARLGDYSDSEELAKKANEVIIEAREKAEMACLQGLYEEAENLLAQGDTAHAAIAFGKLADYQDAWEQCLALWNEIARNTIAAGGYHTVALKADGTVVAVGCSDDGRCDVSDWEDIEAVSAGYAHTVGLKADGTVVAIGSDQYGQCDVSGWEDIAAVSNTGWHTVGLKTDGTVVAVGYNEGGQCDVSGWTDIVAVSAGGPHTVGLKADGTVVAVGDNGYSQCEVSGWTDIVAVSAGNAHTVGLKADGTVVAVGNNEYGQCNVSSWTDIVAVSAGGAHTVGLKADGTVVAVGYNGDGRCNVFGWTDIVAVSAGYYHTVGLKNDGTVVAVGPNEYGRADVSDWTNIKLP